MRHAKRGAVACTDNEATDTHQCAADKADQSAGAARNQAGARAGNKIETHVERAKRRGSMDKRWIEGTYAREDPVGVVPSADALDCRHQLSMRIVHRQQSLAPPPRQIVDQNLVIVSQGGLKTRT